MRIALIILAAGASRRFGPDNKLLADIGGEPMIAHVARVLAGVALPGAEFEVVAVTVAHDDPVAKVLEALPVAVGMRLIANPRAAEGMGTSIAAGVASLPPDVAGALIVPGDMPRLTGALMVQLLAAFLADGGARAVHPVRTDGTKVGPVVWPRARFRELMALEGEAGGRGLLDQGPTLGVALDAGGETVLADIDTPADLARLAGVVGKPAGN